MSPFLGPWLLCYILELLDACRLEHALVKRQAQRGVSGCLLFFFVGLFIAINVDMPQNPAQLYMMALWGSVQGVQDVPDEGLYR